MNNETHQPTSPAEWIAELDQALAGLKNISTVLGAYHRYLLEQGFKRPEALQLVIAYQAHLWNSSQQKPQ